MDLSKIISVTGKSGLFRVVAQGRQAIIAESLEDGKRIPIPASVRVSSLDEISMFTTGEDMPLKDVLTKLNEKAKGGASADPRSDDATLWAKLVEALPTADRGRIYTSDVRKLFLWYAQLLKADLFSKKDEEEDKKKSEAAAAKGDEPKPAKTVSAATKKAGQAAKSSAGGKAKSAPVRRGGQRGS